MESNVIYMSIEELIEKLEHIKEQHGNIPVKICSDEEKPLSLDVIESDNLCNGLILTVEHALAIKIKE